MYGQKLVVLEHDQKFSESIKQRAYTTSSKLVENF